MVRSFKMVFCLGLSRTGTTSLCHALQALGLRTIHYPIHLFTQQEALGRAPFQPMLRLGPYSTWRRSKEIKALECRDACTILGGFDAFGDLPIPLFYRDLDKCFPGSRFIHTTRDRESWIKSMKWLFEDGKIIWKRGRIGDELTHAVYGTTQFDREALIAAFDAHEADVRDYFADRPDDLLSLRVDRGELTFDALKSFLEIESELSGACPKINDARAVSVAERMRYRFEGFFPVWLRRRLVRGWRD